MNQQTRSVRLPSQSRLTLARYVFDQENEDECRALEWVRRFHRSRGIHCLLDVRLSRWPDGTKSVFTVTRSLAKRAGARPEWMVVCYSMTAEAISVHWETFARLRIARAVFKAAGPGFGRDPPQIGMKMLRRK